MLTGARMKSLAMAFAAMAAPLCPSQDCRTLFGRVGGLSAAVADVDFSGRYGGMAEPALRRFHAPWSPVNNCTQDPPCRSGRPFTTISATQIRRPDRSLWKPDALAQNVHAMQVRVRTCKQERRNENGHNYGKQEEIPNHFSVS